MKGCALFTVLLLCAVALQGCGHNDTLGTASSTGVSALDTTNLTNPDGQLPIISDQPDTATSNTTAPADTASVDQSEWSGLPHNDVSVSGEIPPDVVASSSCQPCGYGSVSGIVCMPNAQILVPNAEVTISVIDCDGSPKQLKTYSNADGMYHFPEVPCGNHTVAVSAGSFKHEYGVTVQTGASTDITGQTTKGCFANKAARIAIFWGQWDQMQDLVAKMGLAFTYYNFRWEYFNDVNPKDIEAVQVLRDAEKLAQYDILMFNCGSAALNYANDFPEIRTNLFQFVMAGGSIIASDLAWAYIEAAFPDAIDFYGSTDLPTIPQHPKGPQQALGEQTISATIVDPDLASYVGVQSFSAKYGPGPLIAVSKPGPNTTVLVQGTVKLKSGNEFSPLTETQPLVLVHQPTPKSGRVIFTTFHNDEQADELILKLLYYLTFQL